MTPYETHRGKAIRLANEDRLLPKAGTPPAIMAGCRCVGNEHYEDCPMRSPVGLIST